MPDAADIHEQMRFKSNTPPQTPAQRQAKCRAIKKGTWKTIPGTPCDGPLALPPPPDGRPIQFGPPTARTASLPAPVAAHALPAPPVTAMQKAAPAADAAALALSNAC